MIDILTALARGLRNLGGVSGCGLVGLAVWRCWSGAGWPSLRLTASSPNCCAALVLGNGMGALWLAKVLARSGAGWRFCPCLSDGDVVLPRSYRAVAGR